jgi:RHS repeat-associated protein
MMTLHQALTHRSTDAIDDKPTGARSKTAENERRSPPAAEFRNKSSGMGIALVRSFAAAIALVAALMSTPVRAQQVSGAGIASTHAADTGGGAGMTVPLPVRAERTGLPVPVSVVFAGGGRVGAAGVGWTVPLSYVRFDATVAGRLPRPDLTVVPRVNVTINGSALDLIPADPAGNRFVARDQTAGLELLRLSESEWQLRQGHTRYIFSRRDDVDAGLFLLQEIRGYGPQSRVELNYDVELRDASLGPAKGDNAIYYELRLASLHYNFHPDNGACPGDVVSLSYGTAQAAGVSVPDDVALHVAAPSPTANRAQVVTRVLRSVTVSGRSECSAALKTVSTVHLRYSADTDTGLPRLAGTDVSGRESSERLPIAAYTYGSRSQDGLLEFDASRFRVRPTDLPEGMGESFSDEEHILLTGETISVKGSQPVGNDPKRFVPSDGDVTDKSLQMSYISFKGETVGPGSLPGTLTYRTPELTISKKWAAFVDMTGDGKPDLVYRSAGELKLAENRTTRDDLRFADPVDLFAQGNFPLDEVKGGKLPVGLDVTAIVRESGRMSSTSAVYIQLMDFNGDGRLDIVDARPHGRWHVYINTPSDLPAAGAPAEYINGRSTAHPVFWMKTEVDISKQRAVLVSQVSPDNQTTHLDAKNGWLGGSGRLPLSWTLSGISRDEALARRYNITNDLQCVGRKGVNRSCPWRQRGDFSFLWFGTKKSKSVRIYHAADFNGDGYPDLVGVKWPSSGFSVAGHEYQARTVTDPPGCKPGTSGCRTVLRAFDHEPNKHHWDFTATDWTSRYVQDWQACVGGRFPPQVCEAKLGECWHRVGDGGALNIEPSMRRPHCVVNGFTWMWTGRQRGFFANQLGKENFVVYLNTAGARIGPQNLNDNRVFAGDPLEVPSAKHCPGVAYWESSPGEDSPRSETRRGYQVCGLSDANGDGFLDLVKGDAAFLGNGLEISATQIELSDTVDGQGEPVPESIAVAPKCDQYPGRTHPEYVHDPENEPRPDTFFAHGMLTRTDLDGDGLPENLVRPIGDGRWSIHLGTSSSRAVKSLAYSGPDKLLAAEYDPKGPCDRSPRLVEMLVDVNGDGRLDLTQIIQGRLRMRQMITRDTASGSVDPGLLSAGRLVKVTDGYGAATVYSYANAKHDQSSRHRVPMAEIVVASTTSVGGEKTQFPSTLEPTLFAYGDIEMVYNAIAQRFMPSGYRRTIRLRGRHDIKGPHPDKIKGRAQVVERVGRRGEYESFLNQRSFLIGRVLRVQNFEGYYEDAQDLLDALQTGKPLIRNRRVGETETEPEIRLRVPGSKNRHALNDSPYCNRLDWAYGGSAAAQSFKPSFYCNARVIAYDKTIDQWRGRLPPEQNNKAKPYVHRRFTVESVDVRGRPLRTKDHGDMTTAGDEVCRDIVYADPVSGGLTGKEYRLWGLVKSENVTNCASESLSKTDYFYDGFNFFGLPGHYVDGLFKFARTNFLSGTGAPRRSVKSAVLDHNAYGQVSRVVETNTHPVTQAAVTRTTDILFDPFSLFPIERRSTAGDVDGQVLRERWTHDPLTRRLASTTDTTGATTHFYFDRFGRATRIAVSHPGFKNGAEQIVGASEYFGDDAPTHADRFIRNKVFRTWKALSTYDPDAKAPSQDEQWTEAHLDKFGRPDHTVIYLGPDATPANHLRVVSGRVRYDSLGRLVSVDMPHRRRENSRNIYRTTLVPADFLDEPSCTVSANGSLGNPTMREMRLFHEPIFATTPFFRHRVPEADPARDKVVQCHFTDFANGRLKRINVDPLSLEPNHDIIAGSTVRIFDAMGRLVERRTWADKQADTPLEQIRFTYDRYGRNTRIDRYRAPSLTSPARPVTWSFDYDGLGRLRAQKEPGINELSFFYTDWNQLAYTEQRDGEGIPIRIGFDHDGFGRMKVKALLGEEMQFPLPSRPSEHHIRYQYHAMDAPGAGQVRHIRRGSAPDVSLEYDIFGRVTKVRHVARGGDSQTAEVETVYDGLERVAREIHRVSDADLADEIIRYDYDSAGRMRRIDLDANGTSTVLVTIDKFDEYGHPLKVSRSNGTVEQYTYGGPGGFLLNSVNTFWQARQGLPPDFQLTSFQRRDLLARPSEIVSESITFKLDEAGRPVPDRTIFRDLYRYDRLGQLQSAQRFRRIGRSAESTAFDERYAYDPLGNLAYLMDRRRTRDSQTFIPRADDPDKLCKTVKGVIPKMDDLPRPTNAGCTVTYDTRGQITRYQDPYTTQRRSLRYSHFGEIKRIEGQGMTIDYAFDGLGHRWLHRADGPDQNLTYASLGSVEQRPVQDSAEPVFERFLPGETMQRGKPGTGKLFAKAFSSLAADIEMNGDGVASVRQRLTPYGRLQSIAPDIPHPDLNSTKYRWHGELTCGTHPSPCLWNIYRMGPRLYDAGLGRFLQRDPLLIPRSAGQSHPYQYAWNNPILFNDSTGLDPEWVLYIHRVDSLSGNYPIAVGWSQGFGIPLSHIDRFNVGLIGGAPPPARGNIEPTPAITVNGQPYEESFWTDQLFTLRPNHLQGIERSGTLAATLANNNQTIAADLVKRGWGCTVCHLSKDAPSEYRGVNGIIVDEGINRRALNRWAARSIAARALVESFVTVGQARAQWGAGYNGVQLGSRTGNGNARPGSNLVGTQGRWQQATAGPAIANELTNIRPVPGHLGSRWLMGNSPSGGIVLMSRTTVTKGQVARVIRWAKRLGYNVEVVSGTHSFRNGALQREAEFMSEDIQTMRSIEGTTDLPNGTVRNVYVTSSEELGAAMNRGAGNACVLGTCFSERNTFAGRAQQRWMNRGAGPTTQEFADDLDMLGEYLNMLDTFNLLR